MYPAPASYSRTARAMDGWGHPPTPRQKLHARQMSLKKTCFLKCIYAYRSLGLLQLGCCWVGWKSLENDVKKPSPSSSSSLRLARYCYCLSSLFTFSGFAGSDTGKFIPCIQNFTGNAFTVGGGVVAPRMVALCTQVAVGKVAFEHREQMTVIN